MHLVRILQLENTIGNYWVGTKIGPDGDILHRYIKAGGRYAGGHIGTINFDFASNVEINSNPSSSIFVDNGLQNRSISNLVLDREEKVLSGWELGNLHSEVLPGQTPVMEVAGDGKTGQIIHYRRVGLATMTKVRKVFVQYLEIKVIIRHSRQRYSFWR